MGRGGLLGLIAVIVIVGTVAGIAATGLTGGTPPHAGIPGSKNIGGASTTPPTVNRAALAASCNADAMSVETAVEAYAAQTGHDPADLATLVPTWLRTVPTGGGHYTVYLDGQGRVGVFPAGDHPIGAVPDASDYARHPEICASVPT